MNTTYHVVIFTIHPAVLSYPSGFGLSAHLWKGKKKEKEVKILAETGRGGRREGIEGGNLSLGTHKVTKKPLT